MHDNGTGKQAGDRISTPGTIQAVRGNSDLPARAWGAASALGGHTMTCIFDCILGSLSPRLGGPVIIRTDSRLIHERCGPFGQTWWVCLADVCDL